MFEERAFETGDVEPSNERNMQDAESCNEQKQLITVQCVDSCISDSIKSNPKRPDFFLHHSKASRSLCHETTIVIQVCLDSFSEIFTLHMIEHMPLLYVHSEIPGIPADDSGS
jgi:hypothetical protein